MLESNVIQYRGFHNIVEDGKVTGFQLCIRSDYYRGVWLSQLRPGKVVVDGVTYPKESVIWQINGKDYTVNELAEAGNDFWRIWGYIAHGDKNHFIIPDEKRFDKAKIEDFCREQGIALYDTADLFLFWEI